MSFAPRVLTCVRACLRLLLCDFGTFPPTQLGNHFYEDNSAQFGRHRWVEYAGLRWYSNVEPTLVGADWHGWLHHMTDLTGDNYLLRPPGQITVRVCARAVHCPRRNWLAAAVLCVRWLSVGCCDATACTAPLYPARSWVRFALARA